jgi:2-oxoisovalerate dehydrogenase E1 component
MKTALRAGDPVLMLESKALFASKGPVPEGDVLVPFGVARVAREGADMTIACAGQMVHRALEAAETLEDEGISCEVIDLRTIQPLDVYTVAASVRKTHRLLVVDEAYSLYGVGAELGQAMQELAFDDLDAPVARLHTRPMSHPFAPALERAMLVGTDAISSAARDLMAGVVRPAERLSAGGIGSSVAFSASIASQVAFAANKSTPAKSAAKTPRTAAAVPAQPAKPVPEGEPIKMPFGDLTISEGKLVRWLKKPGDQVSASEVVAEIETEKAILEIESPRNGILSEFLSDAGSMVKMGETIAVVKSA